MFCAPRLVFTGSKGVGSHFHILLSPNRFRRCRVCQVPFLCFALPESFSAVPRASGPVFLFCAPGIIFDGIGGVGVPFSCFALPDSFSAVPRVSGPVFMFCAHRIIFSGTKVVGSLFHVLRSRNHFQRYRWRRVPFSCIALLDSFSSETRASGLVFMFSAPRLVFGGIGGVRSRFHVLRALTHFRRYRGRQVPFSYFALPDSFLAVLWASGPVFLFCAVGFVFGGTDGVGSHFHVLRSRTHFRRYRGRRVFFSCFALSDSFSAVPRASGLIFMFCALGLVFGGTEGVGSRFHVLRSQNRFQRYRGRRVPLPCFALPDTFSAISRV
jgi:hypothetical protein